MRAEASRPVDRQILIDTSSWVHFLRPDGDASTRDRVSGALEVSADRWCALVRLELWNGARGEREKSVLREFERFVPELATLVDVWDDAFALSRRCRIAGVTVPATDVLIYARATYYGAELEHSDVDSEAIRGVPD